MVEKFVWRLMHRSVLFRWRIGVDDEVCGIVGNRRRIHSVFVVRRILWRLTHWSVLFRWRIGVDDVNIQSAILFK